MEIVFERGDANKPKGHALIYFRQAGATAKLYASYLVVPPIEIELTKYMPPLLAGKLSLTEIPNIQAVPLPPIPEEVEGFAYLERLAELREDDLLYGGTIDSTEVETLLYLTSEAAQQYLSLYTTYVTSLPSPPPSAELDVSDVLLDFLSDQEKLGEVAKLIGKLRYAVEGNDAQLTNETVKEIEKLAKRLPESYRMAELIAAAKLPGRAGQRLTQLYLDRCYKLASEDYHGLEVVETEIARFQPPNPQG